MADAQSASARVLSSATGDTAGCIEITVDGLTDLYLTAEGPCDAGRLFDIVSVRPTDAFTEGAVRRYQVLVHKPVVGQPPRGECSCPSGVYHAKPCRHIKALAALWRAGEV